MTFKLTKDHCVLKEDIPDEETFNKIVQAFVDIGAIKEPDLANWSARGNWGLIRVGDKDRLEWAGSKAGITRATPQQILGENYMKDPLYPNGKADDVVNVELTRKEVAILTFLAGNTCWPGVDTVTPYKKLQAICGLTFSTRTAPLSFYSDNERCFITQEILNHFAPRKPTEKELRQAKIAELKQTIAELEALDDHQDR